MRNPMHRGVIVCEGHSIRSRKCFQVQLYKAVNKKFLSNVELNVLKEEVFKRNGLAQQNLNWLGMFFTESFCSPVLFCLFSTQENIN